jgi:hypothetical protein
MAKAFFRRVISFFRDDEKHCSCCSTTNRLSDSSSTLTAMGWAKGGSANTEDGKLSELVTFTLYRSP